MHGYCRENLLSEIQSVWKDSDYAVIDGYACNNTTKSIALLAILDSWTPGEGRLYEGGRVAAARNSQGLDSHFVAASICWVPDNDAEAIEGESKGPNRRTASASNVCRLWGGVWEQSA